MQRTALLTSLVQYADNWSTAAGYGKLCVWFYSETGCSFACDFAILSRNVGILIGSLLRASCDLNFNLLPEQTICHIVIL